MKDRIGIARWFQGPSLLLSCSFTILPQGSFYIWLPFSHATHYPMVASVPVIPATRWNKKGKDSIPCDFFLEDFLQIEFVPSSYIPLSELRHTP